MRRPKNFCRTRIMGYQYDELILLKLIMSMCSEGKLSVREVCNLQKWIPIKRCWYYLEKFSVRGWYDCGVSPDLGWLYRKQIPQEVYKAMEFI